MEELIVKSIMTCINCRQYSYLKPITTLCLTKENDNYYISNYQGTLSYHELYFNTKNQSINMIYLLTLLKTQKIDFNFNEENNQTILLICKPIAKKLTHAKI